MGGGAQEKVDIAQGFRKRARGPGLELNIGWQVGIARRVRGIEIYDRGILYDMKAMITGGLWRAGEVFAEIIARATVPYEDPDD
ncbi:MAG: hypothetical protein BMS9Abin05_2102 [Rhodothermia bacterium]|nr:MAG: hypothetical protein BMS9Abin05_2102 [Rhodothermia bacterium]